MAEREMKETIQDLLTRYIAGTLSQDEQLSLLHYIKNEEPLVIEILNQLQEEALSFGESDVDDRKRQDELTAILSIDKMKSAPVVKTKRSAGKRWYWVAAACILLLGIGVVGYQYIAATKNQSNIAYVDDNEVSAPKTNRAMITLSDGRRVYLDSLSNGMIASQGNVKVVKLANGQLAYQNEKGQVVSKVTYNTLSNPKGSKVIHMQLSDGSKVWLNAGSSITYPVAFVASVRKVTLRGEGYFEVKADKEHPFQVEAAGMQVQVLGTHFNVNAYDDEDVIKTTLLEGKVDVTSGDKRLHLIPGQQALRHSNGTLSENDHVNLEQVMAWKNGFFSFDNSNIQDIMKQISRWYDIEVAYQGKITQRRFGGVIPRESNLNELLEILEESDVHFKLENKKLIVLP